MNRRGFTLVELIAVIVLIALVMLLIVPNVNNLMNDNNTKKFSTYEDMMVEYVRTYPNYKSKDHICLEDLDIDEISKNIACHGYVKIDGNKLKPYLFCEQSGENLYTTDGYVLPSDCK